MSANPHANGGLLRRDLKLPDFRGYAVEVEQAGRVLHENTRPLGEFLRDTMRANPATFRVFGPDETASNRLQAVFEASKKVWMAELLPEDADGGELARDGRVMEICPSTRCWAGSRAISSPGATASSTPTRPSPMSSTRCSTSTPSGSTSARTTCLGGPRWRRRTSCSASTVWRQDHNGFSHQDPGFIDLVTNKSPSVTRVYLPPDANTLLVIADECLRSTDCINVIVADKQKHLQFTTIDQAIVHCAKGIGIWRRASNDEGSEPDVVMASCGDVATQEALAATAILRERLPELKLRFVNVVDLFRMQLAGMHPHGSTAPGLRQPLHPRQAGHLQLPRLPVADPQARLQVPQPRATSTSTAIKERGNINTPLELAILNGTDRFTLVIDVIDRVPGLGGRAAHLKEEMKEAIIDSLTYAHTAGHRPRRDHRTGSGPSRMSASRHRTPKCPYRPIPTRTGLDAETLRQAVLDNLVCQQGRFPDIADPHDWYMALAYTVRDRMLERWVSTVAHLCDSRTSRSSATCRPSS